nr:NDP-hexose 2,3-dehydratase family protein [Lachnospiraceae bacterium]
MSIAEEMMIEEADDYQLHTMEELQEWLEERKESTAVDVKHIALDECDPWYMDDSLGIIRHKNGSFFYITGIRQQDSAESVTEQPIIVQDEIGFLGIIACKVNDTWHYLMQAKIEPGNINVVQISPTLQATKSNFTGAHGGRIPEYLDYFIKMRPDDILVDQIQSEQSSRFLKKRNRNVILKIRERIEESATHRWMTLGQIKEFMKQDNMVNMDTRTVLSCIPYVLLGHDADVPFKNKSYFYKTAWNLDRKTIVELYHRINDYKMLYRPKTEIVRLDELKSWSMKDNEFVCNGDYPFKVIFCEISIEGREVTHWRQPLFASNGIATFGLICCDDEGMIKFLVQIKPEIGCFDLVEIGPTIQREFSMCPRLESDIVESLFTEKLKTGTGIIADCILSEEGGRFYREQNRNVIIKVDKAEIGDLPPNYV